jgi:hypothetical protein
MDTIGGNDTNINYISEDERKITINFTEGYVWGSVKFVRESRELKNVLYWRCRRF